LNAFIEVRRSVSAKRLELRQLNCNPNYEEFEKQLELKKLDSNLKKCTGFVRKIVKIRTLCNNHLIFSASN